MRLKFFEQITNRRRLVEAEIAYLRHLRRQRAATKKRVLMRYFALNYFHMSDVNSILYEPGTNRLVTMRIESCSAMDHVTGLRTLQGIPLTHEAAKGPGPWGDYRYEVTLFGVRDFHMQTNPRDIWTCRTDAFAEVSDTLGRDDSGLTTMAIRFVGKGYLHVVFQDVKVRALRPARLKRLFRGTTPNSCSRAETLMLRYGSTLPNGQNAAEHAAGSTRHCEEPIEGLRAANSGFTRRHGDTVVLFSPSRLDGQRIRVWAWAEP